MKLSAASAGLIEQDCLSICGEVPYERPIEPAHIAFHSIRSDILHAQAIVPDRDEHVPVLRDERGRARRGRERSLAHAVCRSGCCGTRCELARLDARTGPLRKWKDNPVR